MIRTTAKKVAKAVLALQNPKIFKRKVLHRLPDGMLKQRIMRYPRGEELRAALKQLSTSAKNGLVFVFPSPSCPWGYMFQRPQQLAKALADRGFTVIYMVDSSYPYAPDWFVRGLKRMGEQSLYLYNDGCGGGEELVHLSAHLVFWQYWPHQRDVVERIVKGRHDKVYRIYDCIDDLTTFIGYSGLKRDYEDSITLADTVLATASRIFEDLQEGVRPDVLLVPNGVDVGDFEADDKVSNKNSSYKDATAGLSESRWTVGYYGAIAQWFDFDLIQFLAARHPNWSFQLVGEVYPDVTSQAKQLAAYPNITLSKRVPYGEIPRILAGFDVAILPFLKNDITLRTSPVKVYEYLAGGKPTVCTDLPEIMRIPNVLSASNREEFESAIETALEVVGDTNYSRLLRNTAKLNTWQSRIEEVLCHIGIDTTSGVRPT